MRTIAIASVSKKHYGDVFTHVLGLDMTMEEAVEAYKNDFWRRLVKQDKDNTASAYVSIVPIPEEAQEDGDVFQWYDKEITLPEFWEETAMEVKDVIKNGKEL